MSKEAVIAHAHAGRYDCTAGEIEAWARSPRDDDPRHVVVGLNAASP